MAQIVYKTDYYQSGRALFAPGEVASASARYTRELLKMQRAKAMKRPYTLPLGVLLKKDKLFFSSKEVENAKKRFVKKKATQLRVGQ